MANAVNIAVTGLNDAAQRVANAASNIVNASSTSPLPQNADNNFGAAPQDSVALSGAGANTDLASNIVAINTAQVNYGADALVIKTAEKMQQSLLNIVT